MNKDYRRCLINASPLPPGRLQDVGGRATQEAKAERARERGYTMRSLARKLRHQSTDAERMLWKYLRAHRMAGYKFKRQVVIEPYIVDFICLEARLIVEADGGQHLEQVCNQPIINNTTSGAYLCIPGPSLRSPQPSPEGRGGKA